jgi:hypothetical protein
MNESYIVGLFTLAGSAFGFLSALVIANRNARLEERKHFRELGLKIAFYMSQREDEMAQKLADLTKQPRITPPVSVFVVYGLKMMEIASDTSLPSHEVGIQLAQLNKFTDALIAEIRAQK